MFYFKTDADERTYFEAITTEQYETLLSWIKIGKFRLMINLGQKSSNKTALMLAAEKGRDDLLHFLLTQPETDVNLKNPEGQTALSIAILNGNFSIVRILLQDKRTLIDFEDINLAFKSDFPEIHGLLVKYKFFNALQKNSFLQTLKVLHEMQLLRPPLINEVMFEDSGFTPLMYAIQFENTEAIEFLLNLPNLNVNIKNRRSTSALDLALSSPNNTILNQILSANHLFIDTIHLRNARNLDALRLNKFNSLIIKPAPNIFVNLCDQIEFFCEMKENGYSIPEVMDWVNTINKVNKMTPLMRVAQQGDLKTLEYLLAIPGIGLNMQTPKDQKSALLFAVENNQLITVKKLLETRKINLERDAKAAVELAETKNYRAIATIIRNYLPNTAFSYKAWAEEHKIYDIKIEHLCPISLEVMEDPITISSGFTFERKNLIQWYFKSDKFVCPYTDQPLSSNELDFAPCLLVKNRIQEYMEKRKKEWENSNLSLPDNNNIIFLEATVPISLEKQPTFFLKNKKRKYDTLLIDPPTP